MSHRFVNVAFLNLIAALGPPASARRFGPYQSELRPIVLARALSST